VGDEQHRPAFPGAAPQQAVEQVAPGGVEPGVRFIEQEQPRPAGQRHRQARPALLPGREPAEAHAGQPGQPQLLEDGVGVGHPASAGPDPEADVLPDRQIVVGGRRVPDQREFGPDGVAVDGQVVAEDDRRTGRQRQQPGQQPQERRLAGAVGAGDEDDLTLGDVEVDAGQRRVAAEKADGGTQVNGGLAQVDSRGGASTQCTEDKPPGSGGAAPSGPGAAGTLGWWTASAPCSALSAPY
jgi:hypothetical protein